jgi:hypothetical protein
MIIINWLYEETMVETLLSNFYPQSKFLRVYYTSPSLELVCGRYLVGCFQKVPVGTVLTSLLVQRVSHGLDLARLSVCFLDVPNSSGSALVPQKTLDFIKVGIGVCELGCAATSQ